VLSEGYLGALSMWLLDWQWEALRSEVPDLKRPASGYVRDQVRFWTQSLNGPSPNSTSSWSSS
jgi:hypothetical protein